jgi:hypothetical protein
VSGTSSIPIIASVNAVPLKTTARVAVRDREDGLLRRASAVAFLPWTRDDEQRVVDPERQSHRDDHVRDEEVQLERVPDDCGDTQRDDDRVERHQHRDRRARRRAEDEQQHHQRGRQAELQLTLAEVIFGDLDEVPATLLMPVMLTAKPSVPFASQQQGPGRGGAPP